MSAGLVDRSTRLKGNLWLDQNHCQRTQLSPLLVSSRRIWLNLCCASASEKLSVARMKDTRYLCG